MTVSRRRISFEYHQEGASKPLAPFPDDRYWPEPLSLYCTPNKIEIGHPAEKAAARGVPGAFKEWFQHLSSPETVSYLGQQQPVNHLLLLAAEELFRSFLRDVRYNADGGLESCRAGLPLVICFEDDVHDDMRIFLMNLFKNNGYGRVCEAYRNRSVAAYHAGQSKTGNLLIVDSDGVDLTLSLYAGGIEAAKIKQRVILNAGTDPRLQSVCNMIWDKTGAEYSFLNRANEQSRLEQMAAEIISANQTEYEGMMEYSNGDRLSFIVSRSELAGAASGNRSVIADVLRFLEKECGFKPDDVTVVLRNFAAKSDYFSQTLSSEFPNLVAHEEDAIEGADRILVSQVSPWLNPQIEQFPERQAPPPPSTPPIPPIPPTATGGGSVTTQYADGPTPKEMGRRWRQVKAEANGKDRGGMQEAATQMLKDFLSECIMVSGTDQIQKEVETEIAKLSEREIAPPPPPLPLDERAIKQLNREWREVRAVAKSKANNGCSEEARAILTTFLNKVSGVNGTEDLQNDVSKELTTIQEVVPKRQSSSTSKTAAPTPPQKKSKPEKKATPDPVSPSDGETLIKDGKLKEARDWYRSNNDLKQAGLLTDIIRSKKGIDLRRNSLEEYQKSKNKEQAKRIIKEIEEFIDLCVKASVPHDSYRKLLNDYKKI